jgi:hypothetical protein
MMPNSAIDSDTYSAAASSRANQCASLRTLGVNMTRWTLTALFAACACTVARADSKEWTVGFNGFGLIKIGMTPKQVNKVLNVRNPDPPEVVSEECYYLEPVRRIKKIQFMVVSGTVARIDIDNPEVRTNLGARIGDSEDFLKKIYGARLKVERHFYSGSEGNYLTVLSSDGLRAIRFETFRGYVTRYYAGRLEEVKSVEGCS